MNLLKNVQYETKFEHSPKITERRRALFPTNGQESDVDSDLGHISPLSNDPTSDEENVSNVLSNMTSPRASPTKSKHNTEIIIHEHVVCTPTNRTYPCSETMSPLYLSPLTTEINPNTFYNKITSPLKLSPTQSLKTPQETTTYGHKVPKLIRKSILDSIEVSGGGNKRKLSPLNTPEQKLLKLDTKNSKVRTALFPESEVVVPTKTFYSNPTKMNIPEKNISISVKVRNTYVPRRKKQYGQINAGVMHKIRKPKKKKLNKQLLTKAVLDNSETDDILNEYLQDLKSIEQRKSLIEYKENIQPPEPVVKEQIKSKNDLLDEKLSEYKKRPASPTNESNPKKKFFRSRDSISSAINPLNTRQPIENKIVLEAFNTVSNKENSIILHSVPKNRTNEIKNQDAQMMLSPTSQMCDMASGLAINSPKKVRNLTAILENMPNANSNVFNKISTVPEIDNKSKKLYPIFYPEYQKKVSESMKNSKSKQNVEADKKFFNTSENQMILDAGQKRFGLVQCNECNFLYHVGDQNDEILHLNYHRSKNNFRFPGWKNERVIEQINVNERVIQILTGDSIYWWKKVRDVLYVVDRELGFSDLEQNLNGAQVLFYIKDKTVVGCLVAVPRTEAFKLLSTPDDTVDICSQTSYQIKCGVSRIWVASHQRHQGIASSMMNCLKKSFICGTVLRNCDIALSAPTDMGKKFGCKYFQTDDFLIFCE